MWEGVAAAAALSVGVGIGVHLTVETLEGEPRLLAFAAVSLLAVVVLTWMIFWMRAPGPPMKGELEDASTRHAGRGDVRGRDAVAFLAVAREGLEAALFLIAAATTEDGWAVLIGGADRPGRGLGPGRPGRARRPAPADAASSSRSPA